MANQFPAYEFLKSNQPLWHQFSNIQKEIAEIINEDPFCHNNQIHIVSNNSINLGPILKETTTALLCLHYPQPSKHLLPFQVKPDWSEWLACIVAWPIVIEGEWPAWVKRLEPHFAAVWKANGIFEFIHMTTTQVLINKAILTAAIFSLTGLPCIEEEVSALLPTILVEEYDPDDTRTTFLSFQRNSILATKMGGLLPKSSFLLLSVWHMWCSLGPTIVALFLFPNCAPEFEKVDEEDLLTYGISTKLVVVKVDPPCSMTKDSWSSPKVTSKLFQTVELNEQADFTREELQPVTTSPPKPIASAQADSLVIEIDDDVLEKNKIVEEEKNNPDIPSQESIDVATHLLLELLNGNPFELCQVIDQNEAFNASVCMFWSNFPTVYKNFSQRFMNEEKVVSETAAAVDLARQCKDAVEKKMSIYEE
ncbi:hypothetical protein SLEP1_g59308, partial [Rubroshorea leprosula]